MHNVTRGVNKRGQIEMKDVEDSTIAIIEKYKLSTKRLHSVSYCPMQNPLETQNQQLARLGWWHFEFCSPGCRKLQSFWQQPTHLYQQNVKCFGSYNWSTQQLWSATPIFWGAPWYSMIVRLYGKWCALQVHWEFISGAPQYSGNCGSEHKNIRSSV